MRIIHIIFISLVFISCAYQSKMNVITKPDGTKFYNYYESNGFNVKPIKIYGYNKSGRIESIINFGKIGREGKSTYFSEAGLITRIEIYSYNKPIGLYSNGKMEIIPVEFTGKLAEYYQDSSLVFELTFKDSLIDGKQTYLYDHDQTKMTVNYKNGSLHGMMKEWYPSGEILYEISFVNGKKDGEEIEYFKNGKPFSIITFKNGVNHGTAKKWYENGQLYYSVNLVNGNKDGEEYIYNEDGTVRQLTKWNNGTEIQD